MLTLIISMLVAVTAVAAWAWFRRRRLSKEPVAYECRSDELPQSEDVQASQPTDAGMHAPATTDESHEQSTETPYQPITENSSLSQTHANIPTMSEIAELACVPTDAVIVTSILFSPPPFEKPSPTVPVETSETPESEVPVPQTTVPAHHIDTASEDETAKQESIVKQRPAEMPALLETTAASLPTTTPSPRDETELATAKETEPPLAEDEPPPKARSFSEPKPSPKTKVFSKSEQKPDPTPRTDATLPIRLQLVFGHDWSVKMLTLVPHRREGMPNSIDVTTAQGCLRLSEWSADSYQPVPVSDALNGLSEGVVWQARDGTQRWRWELCRREIYVLAAGDKFGLRGFVTRRKDQRLWLNTRHVVLAKESLREQVNVALAEAGCAQSEVCDCTTPGVPSGWVMFRDVTPTRAVKMSDEGDIFNVLCPAHEIEPQFVGGIRLERNIWLAGFPPRIRFAGESANGFPVLIDDQSAQLASDGAFESPGWDAEGEHRLWFGDQAETYSLRTMKEEWDSWYAHDFGTGAVICGASIHRTDGACLRNFCIPAANPLLLGARPGEIFRCRLSNDAHAEWILAMVPFTPVWALPIDRLPKKNCSATLVLIEFTEPLHTLERPLRRVNASSALRQWVFAIRNAKRNQFEIAVQGEDAKALWHRYGVVAKKIRRQLR